MARKHLSFTMRFEVTRSTMTADMKAEVSVRRTAPTVDAALILGRAALESSGWTVGRCTDCRTKLQVFSTHGR